MNLPERFRKSKEVRELLNSIESETSKLLESSINLESEIYIDSSLLGLAYFERLYSIKTDTSQSLKDRRDNIKSKLRTAGVTTLDMIKNICSSYDGDVQILEKFEDYSVTITFLNFKGKPSFFDSLMTHLYEVKPCHIAVDFNILYNTYEDVRSSGRTNSELNLMGLSYGRIREESL